MVDLSKVRAVLQSWREELAESPHGQRADWATHAINDAYKSTLKRCADELEAALGNIGQEHEKEA